MRNYASALERGLIAMGGTWIAPAKHTRFGLATKTFSVSYRFLDESEPVSSLSSNQNSDGLRVGKLPRLLAGRDAVDIVAIGSHVELPVSYSFVGQVICAMIGIHVVTITAVDEQVSEKAEAAAEEFGSLSEVMIAP